MSEYPEVIFLCVLLMAGLIVHAALALTGGYQ